MTAQSGGSAEQASDGTGRRQDSPWWHTAVVYQVYIRSFQDSDGDGIGDIGGLLDRVGHLADLGVDALWINPWYPSPQVDAGYDVADYRAVEPAYGDLQQAEELVAAAHAAGLKVLLDIVPNHTSDHHVWFRAALAGDPQARARYVFRPGRGPDGDEPPNDWRSTFGGPAWTRSTDPGDGSPGEWYLHLFAPEQPDLDWTNPEVRAELEDVLRFWFDREVDGFRVDVAHGLVKADGLPDAGVRERGSHHREPHPAWDQDGVHEVYRGWRRVAESYSPPRVFVAEAWVPSNERLARYLRPDELHTAFQFDLVRAPFRVDLLRKIVEEALAAAAEVGAVSTWVLSNHDVVRQVTRYARTQPAHLVESDEERARWAAEQPDLDLGRRRARAAALLMLALPGSAYVYQGEELGLGEVEDIPGDRRQDPVWRQSGNEDVGRDGCRVPLPWTGDAPPYGFSPAGASAEPWLPQPDGWGALTTETQLGDPSSVLELYRSALRLRREHLLAAPHSVTWLDAPPEVLAFARGDWQCWVNSGEAEVALPVGDVVLCSDPHAAPGRLPGAAAAWLRLG